jgi:twitching motility protein PilJ
VGTLAERSAQAAQRVAALITNIQRDVREVVSEVEKSTQEAEQGYRIAAQAGQRLEEIAAISKQSAQLAETISQATSQQVQNVEQVGSVVQHIAGISQESQSTVLQGRAAAERLRGLAAQLNDSLSRFRLS